MIPMELQRAMAAIEKLRPEWEAEGDPGPGVTHPWSPWIIRFGRKREDGITVVYIAIGDKVGPRSWSGGGARVRIVHYPGMNAAPDFWWSDASDEGKIIFDELFCKDSQEQDRREAYGYLLEYQKKIVLPVIEKRREVWEVARKAREKAEKAYKDAFWKSVGVSAPEREPKGQARKEQPQEEQSQVTGVGRLLLGLAVLVAFLIATYLLREFPW